MNLISHTVGQGPNLVLLHGWGLNSGVWQPLVEKLQASFTVTTIDLPGFGLNYKHCPVSYSLADISHIIAQHIPAQSTVLGWSLGGLVAQQLAILAADKVKHLLVVASSPRFIEAENWPGIKKQVLDIFKQQLEANLSATLSRFLAIQAMGSPTAKQDIKLIKQYVDVYPQANPLALAAGLDILQHSDLSHELHKITCPIDFCLGRLDSLVPLKIRDSVDKLNVKIQVSVFEHSSHAPFISEAERFTTWVINKSLT